MFKDQMQKLSLLRSLEDRRIFVLDQQSRGREYFFEITKEDIENDSKTINFAHLEIFSRYQQINYRCFHCLNEYNLETEEDVKRVLGSLSEERFLEATTKIT